jgi:uncharacterized protein YdiU (UPF0061 family)
MYEWTMSVLSLPFSALDRVCVDVRAQIFAYIPSPTASQQIQAEMAKSQDAARFRKMSAVDKQAADRSAWAAWLSRYAARLAAEAEAGADAVQRVTLMNATNPRCVYVSDA